MRTTHQKKNLLTFSGIALPMIANLVNHEKHASQENGKTTQGKPLGNANRGKETNIQGMTSNSPTASVVLTVIANHEKGRSVQRSLQGMISLAASANPTVNANLAENITTKGSRNAQATFSNL